ncbi:MAG: hypothetical protein Q7J36_00740 [Thiobacillus sp.]|nr:hypothetical protein [Thiobacillus sp.]
MADTRHGGRFGVRGIGSLYHLMYAIQQGLPEDLTLDLIQLSLIAVTRSILVHGTRVKPLMRRFMRYRRHLPVLCVRIIPGVVPSQSPHLYSSKYILQ